MEMGDFIDREAEMDDEDELDEEDFDEETGEARRNPDKSNAKKTRDFDDSSEEEDDDDDEEAAKVCSLLSAGKPIR